MANLSTKLAKLGGDDPSKNAFDVGATLVNHLGIQNCWSSFPRSQYIGSAYAINMAACKNMEMRSICPQGNGLKRTVDDALIIVVKADLVVNGRGKDRVNYADRSCNYGNFLAAKV
ncbi:Hypothetical predicted protein [Olea europaea subsp. europaea]|uniref:Uncharacterized protein n=1 Tax=Olea europaea subsp. europaea TaxID=158383 RepID=A0A8S0Q5H6_OLEEU|nr:Hypothetical predicted protein [Olea europaea subsp. europaea]